MIFALFLAATVLAILIIALFCGASVKRGRAPARAPEGGGSAETGGVRPGTCPLCATVLARGERVKSDISPGKGDRLMRIFGCPRCWPPLPGSPRRYCPVCGEEIAPKGYAIARYFERPGRKHVHVLGCTGCRGSRREL